MVAGSIQVCASLRLIVEGFDLSSSPPLSLFILMAKEISGWRKNLSVLFYVFAPHVAFLEGMWQDDNPPSGVFHCDIDDRVYRSCMSIIKYCEIDMNHS